MSTPNLESPEAYAADVIANAVRFSVSLFLGRGKYDTREADNIAEAAAVAKDISAAHPKSTKLPIITAFDAQGRSAVVTDEKPAPAKKAKKPAKKPKAKKKVVEPEPPAPRKIAPSAGHYGERWTKDTEALWEANAQKGQLPPVPDFEAAPTHAPYRKTLGRLVEAANAGDLDALDAIVIKPISSSRVIMWRWQHFARIALQAKAARRDKRKAKAHARAAKPELVDIERPS